METLRTSLAQEHPLCWSARLQRYGYIFFDSLDGASPVDILARLGQPRPQEDGQPYYVVRAGERLQPGNGGALMPHTDEFNIPSPPRLVSLYCLHPDQDGFGQTLVADGYEWLESLTDRERELLAERWPYRHGDRYPDYPFVTSGSDPAMLRVSFGHLEYRANPEMVAIMDNLAQWYTAHAKPVAHRSGTFLVWNNWRMIHGRGEYRDLRRELHRYYAD